MNAAVNCLDYEYARDPRHYRALQRRVAEVAPRLGRAMAPMGLTCAYWAVPPQPVRLLGGTPPPVLIIGTTNDPATPYEWALGTRRALPASVLLTHEGDGHTVYLSGNRCVDEVVDAYLLTLATPEDGAICARGASGPPRTPPTPPALAAAATPVLPPATSTPAPAAQVIPSAQAGTQPATAPGAPAEGIPPLAPAPEDVRERTREGAVGLRLLAVTVLTLVIALIVVTRRRLMRP
jgi:hypothetical protein